MSILEHNLAKNRRILTKDGLLTTPVIFGTSCLGNLYRELPYSTKLELVKQWFENVEHPTIDSAGKYGAGLALEMIGKCLRELGIAPENITISDKLGWRRIPLTTPEPTFEPGGVWANLQYDARQDISGDGILRCFEADRALIGAPYSFDLVSVHDPDEFVAGGGKRSDIIDAYKSLFELKKSGEVKAVGIGAKDWHIIADIYREIKFDWVMLACAPNVLCHPQDLMDFMRNLQADGVGIINSAVFSGGFLTGGAFFNYRKVTPETEPALFSKRDAYNALCKEMNVDAAAAAVRFALNMPGVCAVSLNTSSPARIAQNAAYPAANVPDSFFQRLREQGITEL